VIPPDAGERTNPMENTLLEDVAVQDEKLLW
jgi:hypothetical protein